MDSPKRVSVGKNSRCTDIKIAVNSEGCRMIVEGKPIQYRNQDGLEESLEKMFDDFLTLIPLDFQLNSLSVRFDDELSHYTFYTVFNKRVPQPLKFNTQIVKSFRMWETSLGWRLVDRESVRVSEYHILEKLENNIIKVHVERKESTGDKGDRWATFKSTKFVKYFREGQEDIYVDEPSQLSPKKQSPKPRKPQNTWNPYFSRQNSLRLGRK
uniref:FBA_2 domain-containing protein n=1 Tax=Caenorhabditis tropicalis TaxID=1561998 RepID=A0A1I7TVK2_9PELO